MEVVAYVMLDVLSNQLKLGEKEHNGGYIRNQFT
jgi:hypothetical protein